MQKRKAAVLTRELNSRRSPTGICRRLPPVGPIRFQILPVHPAALYRDLNSQLADGCWHPANARICAVANRAARRDDATRASPFRPEEHRFARELWPVAEGNGFRLLAIESIKLTCRAQVATRGDNITVTTRQYGSCHDVR